MKKRIFIFLHKHMRNARLRRYFEKRIVAMEGGFAYSQTIRSIYRMDYGLPIGYGTYGGCWNQNSLKWKNISIGNYCCFASNISIFRANHPYKHFTCHPIIYNPIYGGVKQYLLQYEPLTIGHDVWVGQDVVILPSCKKIGNGAIIGAGAIVTHDVQPYTIMVGNPAKIIKYRFSPEIITKIEASQWWTLTKDELISKQDELLLLTK